MITYYKNFKPPIKKITGKRKKYDNNIYTFDIETTSYVIFNEKQQPTIIYDDLSDKEKENLVAKSTMYVWQFGINDQVYFGRTWEELKEFIKMIDDVIPEKKIIFVHNLAFEFQYLYSVFKMENVFARKSHKVIKCELESYNFEFRCTYFMSNTKLENLPNLYNLPVKKLVGDLDYSLIRHSKTHLTEEELAYCENDCLVLYYYILFELKEYGSIDKIPITSTGHVRKELKDIISKDYSYKAKVKKAINTDPHIYNLLVEAFQGGYTHANWVYADEILENVDSYDETSAYPYVMTAYKYPSTKFKPCTITSKDELISNFAYLLVINFRNVKSKYYNNFISSSKCKYLKGAKYDNGRLIGAESFQMTLTDVDFKLYFEAYEFEYEIVESYYSVYNYLPIKFINFILDKYVKKTEYKNVEGKEIEYNLEKQKFNALYGMTVTNNIKDEVIFNGITWEELELDNIKIQEKLDDEEKKSFLSFSYGVWVTAYARANLLKNVMKLDKWAIYMDTDSIKLLEGYDKSIIEHYNQTVRNRIKYVSNKLHIDISRYSPKDKKGKEHMLGLFELEKEDYQEHSYKEFITQGAKKYAVKEVIRDKETGLLSDKIKITVAGVPKSGAKALKNLKEFKDGFIFRYEDTNKQLLVYIDDQEPFDLTDYQGNKMTVTDKSGCCMLPNSYTLGKSLDYAHLISDDSSKRSIYKE